VWIEILYSSVPKYGRCENRQKRRKKVSIVRNFFFVTLNTKPAIFRAYHIKDSNCVKKNHFGFELYAIIFEYQTKH
jgi:hypothetical protein